MTNSARHSWKVGIERRRGRGHAGRSAQEEVQELGGDAEIHEPRERVSVSIHQDCGSDMIIP